MRLLGNQNTFAIEYNILPYPGEDATVDDWGCVYFWVNGRNLFAFEKNVIPGDTFLWHMFYLVRWFCDNLIYIMDENDYPNNIKGENSFDILRKFRLFQEQFDNDSEEYWALHDIRLNWDDQRRISEASGASCLPDMLIRAVNGKIEVQWDNSMRNERGMKFLYLQGLEYIDQKEFFQVVTTFCKELLDRFEKQHPLPDLRTSLENAIETYAQQ